MPNDIVKRDNNKIQPSRREIAPRRETSVRRHSGIGFEVDVWESPKTPARDRNAELLAERRREREANQRYAREEAAIEAEMKAYRKEHGLDPESQRTAKIAVLVVIVVIVLAIALFVAMIPPAPPV